MLGYLSIGMGSCGNLSRYREVGDSGLRTLISAEHTFSEGPPVLAHGIYKLQINLYCE